MIVYSFNYFLQKIALRLIMYIRSSVFIGTLQAWGLSFKVKFLEQFNGENPTSVASIFALG
jgi:hypothetical protein